MRRHGAQALRSPTGLRTPLSVLSANRPPPQTLFPKAVLSLGVFLRTSRCFGRNGENTAQMLTGFSRVVPPFPRGSWGAELSSQDWSYVLHSFKTLSRILAHSLFLFFDCFWFFIFFCFLSLWLRHSCCGRRACDPVPAHSVACPGVAPFLEPSIRSRLFLNSWVLPC